MLPFLLILLKALLALGLSSIPASHSGFCGKVLKRNGVAVSLFDGVPISSEDFELIHTRQLKGVDFRPHNDESKVCAIQVCGFNSWGTSLAPYPDQDRYFGTTSDYADCDTFTPNSTAAVPHTYNDDYNTSSIMCGCLTDSRQCTFTCETRAQHISNWSTGSCAIFYQELDCNSCFLPSFPLYEYTNYTSNFSSQVRTMIVRPGCEVYQLSPELRRYWLFRNVEQPLIYSEGPTVNAVNSPFIYGNDPDTFTCKCGIQPPSPQVDNQSRTLYIFIGLGALTSVLVALVAKRVHTRRRKKAECDRKQLALSNSCMYSESSDLFPDQVAPVPNLTLDTDRSLFQVGSPLASGQFGEVYSGVMQVAIKRVRLSLEEGENQTALRSLHQEIKILAQLAFHENVVRILGTSLSNENIEDNHLIIELCACSLHSYLTSTIRPRVNERLVEYTHKKWLDIANDVDGYMESVDSNEGEEDDSSLEILDPETNQQFFQWFLQIISGMMFIQSKDIIHVDLAARNVLLSHKMIAKIGDFGLSKQTYLKTYATFKKDVLPLRWAAIECFGEGRASPKSDVWSFGITVWEMYSLGEAPYENLSLGQMIMGIYNGNRLKRPKVAPKHIYDKLQECWNLNPEDRPNFKDLLGWVSEQMQD